LHEAANAVDQASREVSTRFDFKGTDAKFEQNENIITLSAEASFQLQQMLDILQNKLTNFHAVYINTAFSEPQNHGKTATQIVTLQQGLDSPLAKEIVKLVKAKKLKVQSSIQGDKVRITGKKRDDLQQVIAMLKEEKLSMPLQFDNFRD
jgi:uncharacterized protein YajQ (UPF0234 family)